MTEQIINRDLVDHRELKPRFIMPVPAIGWVMFLEMVFDIGSMP